LPGSKRERVIGAGDSSEKPRLGGIKSYRSIWISDLHLGARQSRAAALLDFLRSHEAENLFLVGDVIEDGNAGAQWCWSANQQAVIEELRAWSRRGSRVELLPGDHDRDPTLAARLLGLRVRASELVHRTGEGRIMLVDPWSSVRAGAGRGSAPAEPRQRAYAPPR